MGLIEYIPWKFWITLMIIVLIVMWFFLGGRRDYEIIGLRNTKIVHQAHNPPIDTHTFEDRIQYVDSLPSSPSQKLSYNRIGQIETRRHTQKYRQASKEDIDQQVQTNHYLYTETLAQVKKIPVQTIGAFNVTQLANPCPASTRKISIGEQLTGQAFESIIGRKIETQIRPLFLKNPETGRPLELDCYDPINRIAVEYSGKQHYEYPSSFHSSIKEFYDQVYRDNLKKILCDQNRIYLITIPYWVDMCDDDTDNKDNLKCVVFVPKNIRYQRIRNYLEDQLNILRNASNF